MSDDLVERLRGWPAVIKANDTMFEAADRIEELEAKLAKAVELGLEECPFWDGSGAYNDWWHDRRTTLKELTGDKDE